MATMTNATRKSWLLLLTPVTTAMSNITQPTRVRRNATVRTIFIWASNLGEGAFRFMASSKGSRSNCSRLLRLPTMEPVDEPSGDCGHDREVEDDADDVSHEVRVA